MADPIASYAFIPDSEPRAFYSAEELKKELAEELAFWKWLEGKSAYPNAEGMYQVIRVASEKLNGLSAAAPETLRKDAQLQQSITSMAKHYQRGKALHRSHLKASWVEHLRQVRSEATAGFALEAFLLPGDGSIAKAEAHAAVGLYELGFTPQQPPAQRFWEGMRAEHEALYTKHHKRLQELLERYEQLIPIEAPVKLWSDLRNEMKWSARLYLAFLIAAVGLSVWGLGWLVGNLFGAFGYTAAYTPDQYQGVARFWAPAVLVLAVSGVIWVLRIIAKLYFSAVHLGLDARERMAMANTYLALMEKQHVDKERMAIVLNSLFRPATTGVIKEPPEFGLIDAIARRLPG